MQQQQLKTCTPGQEALYEGVRLSDPHARIPCKLAAAHVTEKDAFATGFDFGQRFGDYFLFAAMLIGVVFTWRIARWIWRKTV